MKKTLRHEFVIDAFTSLKLREIDHHKINRQKSDNIPIPAARKIYCMTFTI